MAKYIYGQLISSEKIVNIEEIPNDHSLRRIWACVCPQCGMPLTARKGSKREAHFSHKPISFGPGGAGVGCSAEAANETALHKMAKNIIKKELQIALPAKEIPLRDINLNLPRHITSQLPQSFTVFTETILSYNNVSLEERIEDFQPDAIIRTKEKTYFIEIKVAHKTSPDKIKKVEIYGLSPMLEIDLSSFSKAPITENELRNLICTKTSFREWIFFPNENTLLEEARNFFETHKLVVEYCEGLARQKAFEQEEQRKQAELNAKRQKYFQPNNYSKVVQDYRNKTRKITDAILENRRFYKEKKEIPFFVNIPVTGEILFNHDRVAWQSYLFDRWIYNRKKDNAPICIFEVFNELKNQGFSTNDLFDYGKTSVPGLLDNTYLPYQVICKYLGYLEQLGFIEIEKSKKMGSCSASRKFDPAESGICDRT